MLVYRIIQGAGGGTLIPASQAITREKFPPAEQGMAMALYSMGVMLAPTIGPVLGGWLVDTGAGAGFFISTFHLRSWVC